jgi:hypothetical protein
MAVVTIRQGSGIELPVFHGGITMPRVGAWQADLWVESKARLTGRVTITAGALSLSGTVYRGGMVSGVLRTRVIAGGDGLRKLAHPKHYTSPTFRLVLSELAAAAGEAVSPKSDQGILAATLLGWTTIGVRTGPLVGALVEMAGDDVAWRLLPDGTIWVGHESYPESGVKGAVEMEEDAEQGWVLLGDDVPRVLPGTTVGGRKVDLAEHLIGPSEVRTKVWLAP